jgi:hypothetical protein
MRSRLNLILSLMIIIALVAPGYPGAFGAVTVTYEESNYSDDIFRAANFSDLKGHWATTPIYRMAAQGVIKGDGKGNFRPEATLTKEEALALILRIAGAEQDAMVAAEVQAENRPTQRGEQEASVAPERFWADGYLQVAANRGIITQLELEEIRANPNRPAQRQEVAAWLSKALGLTAVYGINIQKVHSFTDRNEFNPAYLSAIEPLLQQNIMGGDPGGSFRPAATIKRGEMASILDRAARQRLGGLGTASFEGRIVEKTNRWEGASNAGQWVDLEVQLPGLDRARVSFRDQGGFPVLKNQQLVRASTLAAGEQVEFIYNPDNGQILMAQVLPSQQGSFDGYFGGLSGDGQSLRLQDPYSGQRRTIPLSSQVVVIIDGRPGRLADLLPGQEVSLKVSNNAIVGINATFGPYLAGYDAPTRPQVKLGRVKEILGEYLVITDNGQEESYRLSAGTSFIRGRQPISLGDLRIGDRVRLEVADPRTGQVSLVEVSNYEGLADKVVRGRLNAVYPEGRQVSLVDPQEYFYGSWYPLGTLGGVVLDSGADIYLNNQLVSLDELRRGYLGHEVYIALSSTPGSLLGSKMMVRGGESRPYNGIVDQTAWALNRFSLVKQGENFLVDEGTIAIRDGKLVDPQDFKSGEHVFLETVYTGSGEYSALMQHFQGVPPRLRIYAGRLEDIDRRSLELYRASELVGNQWKSISSRSTPELIFDNKTRIWDAWYEGDWITPDYLAESRWSEWYRRMDAFIIADENNKILAMTLRRRNPDVLKTSVARVVAADPHSNILTLDRVQDWSEGYQRWVPNPDSGPGARRHYNLQLDTEDALLYLGSSYGTIGELNPGDVVYVVHYAEYNDYYACLIFKQ